MPPQVHTIFLLLALAGTKFSVQLSHVYSFFPYQHRCSILVLIGTHTRPPSMAHIASYGTYSPTTAPYSPFTAYNASMALYSSFMRNISDSFRTYRPSTTYIHLLRCILPFHGTPPVFTSYTHLLRPTSVF